MSLILNISHELRRAHLRRKVHRLIRHAYTFSPQNHHAIRSADYFVARSIMNAEYSVDEKNYMLEYYDSKIAVISGKHKTQTK